MTPVAVERKAVPRDEGQPAPHKRAGGKNHKGLYVLVVSPPWSYDGKSSGYYRIESVVARRNSERIYACFEGGLPRWVGEVIDGPAPYDQLERAMVAFKSGKRAA